MAGKWMDRLDLPEETAPGETVIEIAGHRRVLIEHHRGVIQYGSEEIHVKVKYGCVHICGQSLELTRMTGQQLIVSGCIDSVSLERKG